MSVQRGDNTVRPTSTFCAWCGDFIARNSDRAERLRQAMRHMEHCEQHPAVAITLARSKALNAELAALREALLRTTIERDLAMQAARLTGRCGAHQGTQQCFLRVGHKLSHAYRPGQDTEPFDP